MGDPQEAETLFYKLLSTLRFVPNSPPSLAPAPHWGNWRLLRPPIETIWAGIPRDLPIPRDAALIQQTGGGNGFSFSRLRPKKTLVASSMGQATGPLGFLRVYDRAFGEIAQGAPPRRKHAVCASIIPTSSPSSPARPTKMPSPTSTSP